MQKLQIDPQAFWKRSIMILQKGGEEQRIVR